MLPENVTRQQVVELVMTLPADRLMSVYDFVRFIQSHPLETASSTDLFGETADEVRADEEQWAQQFAASRKELRAMARAAAADYRAGKTRPLEFTPEGQPVR